MQTGSCECGAVQYELTGEMRPPVSCHCTQCRKTSGHFWAATQVPTEHLKLTRDEGLKWYRSSDWAQRGFCGTCGSSLFWKMDSEDMTSVGAGTLDGPTGLETAKHICVATKGDYYHLADGVPQLEKW